jgi:hypothetical protein
MATAGVASPPKTISEAPYSPSPAASDVEPLPADEQHGRRGAGDGAGALRGLQDAEARAAHVQEVERRGHRQDGEHPVDEGLRRHQKDDEPHRAIRRHGREPARERVQQVRLLRSVGAARYANPRDQRRRPQHPRGGEDKHDLEARHRQQDGADRGPRHDAHALDRARDHVGCSELVGLVGEGREQRGLGRLERSADDSAQARNQQHADVPRVGDDQYDHHARECRANEVARHHHSLAPVPIGDHATERRDDRRRDHPKRKLQRHAPRPGFLEREDADCDRARPLPHRRAEIAELKALHVAVSRHRAERGERFAKDPQHPAQDGRAVGRLPVCAIEGTIRARSTSSRKR